MNLLLCYYCFGRAAHARCLSHSVCPAAPQSPRSCKQTVNSRSPGESIILLATPLPRSVIFFSSLSFSLIAVFFFSPPLPFSLSSCRSVEACISKFRPHSFPLSLSFSLFCIYARNVLKMHIVSHTKRLLMILLCTYYNIQTYTAREWEMV